MPDDNEASLETVPDHVPRDIIHPLDHWNGVEYRAYPVGFWDSLRDRFRVFWSPLHGGFWCLTRHEDIHEAFQRPDLFSNRIVNIPGREMRLLPISLDPPEHTKYRRLLNQPFAPARIDALTPRIRDLCNKLIDEVVDQGGCDFVGAVAQPLPTQIFCETLGLPVAEAKKFVEWNYVILHVRDEVEGPEQQRRANEEVGAYLRALIDARKEDPHDDLVTVLLHAEVDGHTLTDDEVLAMTNLLFMAGLDTVTAALSWSWSFLAQHPEHRQQIIDDPKVVPAAVEELLRFHSFVQPSRTLTRDVEFAGVTMRAGDRIMLPTASADRDEHQFPNPEVVDFHREPNRHLAFAAGPHRCVGSHLARAEMTIALEEWHRRVPQYHLADDAVVQYHGGAVAGPESLPLVFDRPA